MPDVSVLSASSDMGVVGSDFDRFFEEVIASPELNLLDDVFPDDDVQDKGCPILVHPYMPILHRLQPVSSPSLPILKAHANPILPAPTAILTTESGGISPTLTWSGDPSPIDQDNSPTLHDSADLDGEEWKSPTVPNNASRLSESPLFEPSSGRGRRASTIAQSQARSRSSKSSSSNSAGDGGDELTMSNLSIKNSLSALLASPPSPAGGSGHTTRPNTRKKSRTNSSSRSSISSIDALITEAMGGSPSSKSKGVAPTGHRRNITSASLVPLDAPTQVRNYLTPSSTSKKDIPSAFVARRNKLRAKESNSSKATTTTAGRKRTREEAGLKIEPVEDEAIDQLLEDETTPLNSPDNPAASPSTAPSSPTNMINNPHNSQGADIASESSSLLSAIEAKRRQNTLAARRSRQRKLDYVRGLEELVTALTKERDNWKTRAVSAEKVLGYTPGDDDMDEDEDE